MKRWKKKVSSEKQNITDWCLSIATAIKKDKCLRGCLNPKYLNDTLKYCVHKIPTLEELNPEFADTKVVSKVDAKAAYWSLHLDEYSQELTPFSRYCYTRLTFGLSVSQDFFQQAMDCILAKPPGCVGIADDVVVHSHTAEEYDLLQLMNATYYNS